MKKQEFKRSKIVIKTPVYCLHVFNYGDGVPVLVLPPYAGRSGNIAQRMIDKCVKLGKSVYAYELLPATRETADTSILDLIEAVSTCQRYINEPVDLVCLCQGGWLGAIYTSLFPETVNRLALFATPINTKTGQENVIEKYCSTASMPWHRLMVAMAGGLQPGAAQWAAFAMVDPSFVFLKRWFDLYNCCVIKRDLAGLEKWEKNNDWYDSPQDLAGVWFLDCLENHFIENRLYDGTWDINGLTIDLNNITCPVYLYAGGADQITHPRQVFDMENVISTPPEHIHKKLFEGAGHTKALVGGKELDYFAGEFF